MTSRQALTRRHKEKETASADAGAAEDDGMDPEDVDDEGAKFSICPPVSSLQI